MSWKVQILDFFNKNKLTIVMIPIGASLGLIYWYFWGCEQGCAIRANWHTNLVYGGLMGGLLGNIISDIKRPKNSNQNKTK